MARSRGDDPHGFLRQSLSRRWHAPACVASHRMTNLSDSSVQEILPSPLSVVGRDPSLRSTWLSAEQQVGAGSLNANRDHQIKSHYTAQTKQKELNKMATSSKNNPKAFDRTVCFTVFREWVETIYLMLSVLRSWRNVSRWSWMRISKSRPALYESATLPLS